MKLLLCALYLITTVLCASDTSRVNIVLIIADDLGWNDVGYHGSNQVPTPNIDVLAYSGLSLQNYYVTPVCSPSRAALVTAKYPIHTGMQHSVLYGTEPRGLPLSEKILPQYLKELGYNTHLVGKWHLGHYRKEYLPLNRGFDSHLGFWTGKIDYYDHTNQERGSWGHDFRRDFEVAYDLFGQYATDVYSQEAAKIIERHNTSAPLFLMVAHSAVHSGNPYTPLRAPDHVVDSFINITDTRRRRFAGMLTKLDESVGVVVKALQDKNMLNNSLIIFTTDNGGPANGFNDNAASNYPLRGVKNTLWEGGVRGAGLLWSPLVESPRRVARQRIHLADWLPTLYGAAGGDTGVFKDIDGEDLWESLSKDLPSKRDTVVHNIDDIFGSAAITRGKWKIHKGTNYNGAWDFWYGPSGRKNQYDIRAVLESPAGRALVALNMMPDEHTIMQIRNDATIKCNDTLPVIVCKPLEAPCLFDIEADPCERRNLAELEPEVLESMLSLLREVNATVVPPNNQPDDPRGDPKYWGRVFTNFRDYEMPRFIMNQQFKL